MLCRRDLARIPEPRQFIRPHHALPIHPPRQPFRCPYSGFRVIFHRHPEELRRVALSRHGAGFLGHCARMGQSNRVPSHTVPGHPRLARLDNANPQGQSLHTTFTPTFTPFFIDLNRSVKV
jgi:hypothetical protein